MKQSRLNRELSYIWVAELQKNGNIHFHILFNQFFPIQYLTKIWNQANNSVDIQTVKDPLHAARYMRKYITKDEDSEIQGNRYFISHKLRQEMQPVIDYLAESESMADSESKYTLREIRQFLTEASQAITHGGGFVLDFGFNIPPPRSPAQWKDKKTGEIKTSNGVSPMLSKHLFTSLYEISKSNLPF